ncbi:hypothetical protein D3C75_1054670 [compost metagenome]
MRNHIITTVNCQGVLRQIIGTDTEEVDFFSQVASNRGRSRSLNHHANFDSFVKRFAFFTQLRLHDFNFCFQCTHFFNRDDHWEHDA